MALNWTIALFSVQSWESHDKCFDRNQANIWVNMLLIVNMLRWQVKAFHSCSWFVYSSKRMNSSNILVRYRGRRYTMHVHIKNMQFSFIFHAHQGRKWFLTDTCFSYACFQFNIYTECFHRNRQQTKWILSAQMMKRCSSMMFYEL